MATKQLLILFTILLNHAFKGVKGSNAGVNESTSANQTDLSQTDDDQLFENGPEVQLVKYSFHTNDILTNHERKNYTDIYILPLTFKTLEFVCLSNYPTSWKFYKPPYQDPSLKDIVITKIRKVNNLTDFEKTNSNFSVSIFVSKLMLNFKDTKEFPRFSCRNSKNNMLYDEAKNTVVYSSRTDNPLEISIIVEKMDDSGLYNKTKQHRAGSNDHCNVTLNFDLKNQRFSCGSSSGGHSRPRIINCNTRDECNSIFVPDTNTCKNINNNTFRKECKNLTDCFKFSPSKSPGVIICYDEYNNSIARKYIVTQQNNFYLGSDTILDLVSETIVLEHYPKDVYELQNMTFCCKGTASYYTYGFQWILNYTNEKGIQKKYLGTGVESYNETMQIYETNITVHLEREYGNKIVVSCFAPRWNRDDWEKKTIDVDILKPEPPQIRNESSKNCGSETGNKNQSVFNCLAKGSPAPLIKWIVKFDERSEEWSTEQVNAAKQNFTHLSYTTTGSEANGTLQTNSTLYLFYQITDRHKVDCSASNYIGTVSTSFTCKDPHKTTLILKDPYFYIGLLSVLLIASIIAGIYFTKRYRTKYHVLSDLEIEEFEKGDPTAENALLLPYNLEYEIPRDEIIIDKSENAVLGEGQFGKVLIGTWKSQRVAVKMVKKSADVAHFKALLSEIKVMCYLDKHPNLVNIVGACTRDIRKRDVLLVIEFCPNGNLQNFLRKSRSNFIDILKFTNPKEKQKQVIALNETEQRKAGTANGYISTINLITWAYQCTCGMEYLALRNVIHGDLATRNILLTDHLHAKVGDFGLSKQLFDYSVYVQKFGCPLPLKWMAIESLQDLEFSIQSDVWAYGITLWEIFSLGQSPYPGIPQWDFQSYLLLQEGYRMERPEYSSSNIYLIMKACWEANPKARPSFMTLKESLISELLLMQR